MGSRTEGVVEKRISKKKKERLFGGGTAPQKITEGLANPVKKNHFQTEGSPGKRGFQEKRASSIRPERFRTRKQEGLKDPKRRQENKTSLVNITMDRGQKLLGSNRSQGPATKKDRANLPKPLEGDQDPLMDQIPQDGLHNKPRKGP